MWRMPVDVHDHQAGGEFLANYYMDGGVRKTRSLLHSGQDESGHPGQTVYAVGPGKVVKVGTNVNSGWGNHVYVDHGGNVYSFYAHLRDTPAVSVGQDVDGGAVLGYVGRTGTQAAGNHLHWGIGIGDFATINAMGAAARSLLVEPEGYVNSRIAANKILPTQRRVIAPKGARRREGPWLNPEASYDGTKNFPLGTVITPRYWTQGDSFFGDDRWWVVDGLYTHFSGVGDPVPHDIPWIIPPIKPGTVPVPVNPVPTDPIPEPPVEPAQPPVEPEPEPEQPPVDNPVEEPVETPTKPPIVAPDATKVEEALATLGKQASPFIPKALRKKIYAKVKWAATAAAALGVTALAVAPAVGGEVGSYIATVGASAAIVGTGLGALAAALADDNTDTSLDA